MHTCTLIILIDFNFYKNSKKINIFKKIVHSQILNNRNIKINTNKINITWMISFWSKIKFSFMLFYFIHIIQHSKCWLFFFLIWSNYFKLSYSSFKYILFFFIYLMLQSCRRWDSITVILFRTDKIRLVKAIFP